MRNFYVNLIVFISLFCGSFAFGQSGCNDLDVISVENDVIVCQGSGTLVAKGSGVSGSQLRWYDAEVGGEFLGKGEEFKTPELSSTTSFWVEDASVKGAVSTVTGQAKPQPAGGTLSSSISHGVQFDAFEAFIIESVEIHTSSGGTPIDIQLQDENGNSIDQVTVTIPSGASTSKAEVLELGIEVPGPGTYILMRMGTVSLSAKYDSSGNNYPYPIGSVAEATGMESGAATNYYYFYNWTITEDDEEVICATDREEVVAEITTDGDEIVNSLPYSHSANTSTYGNNYTGAPGDSCSTDENYFNGSEVVYEFTANDDTLVNIDLSDLKDYYAGVFVYESCADIGDECAAGASAGPGTDDLKIRDFSVEDGQSYYIVVSSWLTSSVDYTIDINYFDCATLEAPEAVTLQLFVAGDLVSDLDVDRTHKGADLTWFDDSGLTNEISDYDMLVDAMKYYVTQTVLGCEGPALMIEVEEIDCSSLEIVSVTDDQISCRGEMFLKANSSGTGDEIYWYESESGDSLVNKGSTFLTPILTETKSYWVEEVMDWGPEPLAAQGKADVTPGSGIFTSAVDDRGLHFKAYESFSIDEVDVYVHDVGGSIDVELQDDKGEMIKAKTFNVPSSGSSSSTTTVSLRLDFDVPGAGEYQLVKTNGSNIKLGYESGSDVVFPYPLGSYGEVTDGVGTSGSYFNFYRWTVSKADIVCASPRKEVKAIVDQSGDISLDYSDLPYTDTDNTSSFGNSFEGDAGDGCEGDGYLQGPDVSYYYTADPNEDEILQIELTGVDNPNAGIFVYHSCGDVGYDCLGGATVDDDLLIEELELYVEAGEDILIVVSSSSGSVDYTLNINRFECNDANLPTGDPDSYFMAGDMLTSLDIGGSAYNEGFRWYRDSLLTDEITNPNSELLVDGDTYYITQTLLGCESDALEINPIEFNCNDLAATPEKSTYYVCVPGGETTVYSDSTGLGEDVYWYDAPTDGNIAGRGNEIVVDVDEDTSFWVSEVRTGGETTLSGQGKPELVGGNISGSVAHGLRFNAAAAFTLNSVDVYPGSGTYDLSISLYDGDGDLLDTKKTTVTNSNGAGAAVTIDLDFEVPVGNDLTLFEDGIMSRSLGYDSNDDFPYDIGYNGEYGEITSGANNPIASTNLNYYYFYNWNIMDIDVICESPRSEILVKVNDEIPEPPIVKGQHEICGEGALLSDIVVLGKDLRWYSENGKEVSSNTAIYKGEKYYVTQTIRSCESNEREVLMDFQDKSDQPLADVNQSFESGEDLTDLEVVGDNLRWYRDQFKSEELSEETLLEDQTTYYVTQDVVDNCESDPLGITVHRMLDVDNPLFESFEYYPNPVESKLHISNTENIERIEVYDITGRKILDKKYNEPRITLDASDWAAATYLIRATVDRTERTFRVIKK